MYCTKCGNELRERDRFCPQCGDRTQYGIPEPSFKRLVLDKREKKIAGVCAGFAQYLDVDVTLVRVLWLATALMTGVGFIAYIAAWIIMPGDHGREAQAVIATNPQAG